MKNKDRAPIKSRADFLYLNSASETITAHPEGRGARLGVTCGFNFKGVLWQG
jgi:hypothetical protein